MLVLHKHSGPHSVSELDLGVTINTQSPSVAMATEREREGGRTQIEGRMVKQSGNK